MTQKQHRAGLALAGTLMGGVLLLLLVSLVTRSSDRLTVGLPMVVGGVLVVAVLLAFAWRAVTDRTTGSR